MKAYTFCAIAIFSVVTLCGIMTISAQSPPCRARTLDLRAFDNSGNVNFDHSQTSNTQTGTLSTTGVDCAHSGAMTHTKGAKPQAMQADTGVSQCEKSWGMGDALSQAHSYAKSYDTLKLFVESCPTNHWASYAFGDMSHDVQGGGNGPVPGCWVTYRQWLLSALAWNPHDPDYFCADVGALAGAGNGTYNIDTSWAAINANTNRGLAIIRWLIDNPYCTNASWRESYTNSRGGQWLDWAETQDTNKVKLDTTLPSMHDLGLDSVLKYAAMLSVHSGQTDNIILDASAYPNPSTEGTVISFGMKREAYVNIEVFDLLGNVVVKSGFESILEPGKYSVPISLHALPSGTYFARILTTYGEAQTLKLVKE